MKLWIKINTSYSTLEFKSCPVHEIIVMERACYDHKARKIMREKIKSKNQTWAHRVKPYIINPWSMDEVFIKSA